MTTAEAKRLHLSNGVPVYIVGRDNRPVWSEVFENNPRLARSPIRKHQMLVDGPGVRPYIMAKNSMRWYWRRHRRQQPGELYLTEAEKAFGAKYAGGILIEPNVKATNGHTNKAWPFDRWQALVRDFRGVKFVQCAAGATRWLDGVERVRTPSFRMACAVLAASRAIVCTEGALHHAAAALNVPTIVLWSEFISCDVTGYECQHNIRHAGEPCGSRVPCVGCAKAMAAISVAEVAEALSHTLNEATQ